MKIDIQRFIVQSHIIYIFRLDCEIIYDLFVYIVFYRFYCFFNKKKKRNFLEVIEECFFESSIYETTFLESITSSEMQTVVILQTKHQQNYKLSQNTKIWRTTT